MTSLYREILKKAWQIIKKYKILWVFGIFAAFLGNASEYQTLFNQISQVTSQSETLTAWSGNLHAIWPKLDLSIGNLLPLIAYWLVMLVILAFFVWVVVNGLGGLIKGAALAENNQSADFKTLFKAGSAKFPTLLGLNVVAKAIVYGFLILVINPLMIATFAQGSQRVNTAIIILSFLIFVPLTIIVSLVTKYASAYTVLNGEKFSSAFKNGLRLFAANWLVSLEMGFIIFVINLAIGLVFALFALLLFSPFFFLGVIYTVQNPYLFTVLTYIAISLLFFCSIVVGAGLSAFQVSSWTLLYLRLNSGVKAYSKIVRWVSAWPKKADNA